MDWGTSDWRSGGCHGLPNINEPQRSPSMPSPAMPRHMRPPGLILGHQVVRSWAKMGQDGPRWAKMGQDGPKCLEIFGDLWRWIQQTLWHSKMLAISTISTTKFEQHTTDSVVPGLDCLNCWACTRFLVDDCSFVFGYPGIPEVPVAML